MNNIENLLKQNSYPGRGIIIGKSLDGKKAVFAYFIMGRSENSRNRIFVENNSEVTIFPYDNTKVSDPRLIIYSPVRQLGQYIIVTNGDQTDTIYSFIQKEKSFEEALNTRLFEPDYPNFTPRISGIINFYNQTFNYKLSILKCADNKGKDCAREYHDYEPKNGVGHFIHTYKNDGNPLVSFAGEPKAIKIIDDIDLFADGIWNDLNFDNKISLYVKYIDLETGRCATKLYNKNN
jgi:IMP cyclohydrolase